MPQHLLIFTLRSELSAFTSPHLIAPLSSPFLLQISFVPDPSRSCQTDDEEHMLFRLILLLLLRELAPTAPFLHKCVSPSSVPPPSSFVDSLFLLTYEMALPGVLGLRNHSTFSAFQSSFLLTVQSFRFFPCNPTLLSGVLSSAVDLVFNGTRFSVSDRPFSFSKSLDCVWGGDPPLFQPPPDSLSCLIHHSYHAFPSRCEGEVPFYP